MCHRVRCHESIPLSSQPQGLAIAQEVDKFMDQKNRFDATKNSVSFEVLEVTLSGFGVEKYWRAWQAQASSLGDIVAIIQIIFDYFSLHSLSIIEAFHQFPRGSGHYVRFWIDSV